MKADSRATPGGPRFKPRDRHAVKRAVNELVDQMADPLPARPPPAAVPRPVDEERLTFYLVERHRAPESALVAAVAVVAYPEDVSRRPLERAEVVTVREGAAALV